MAVNSSKENKEERVKNVYLWSDSGAREFSPSNRIVRQEGVRHFGFGDAILRQISDNLSTINPRHVEEQFTEVSWEATSESYDSDGGGDDSVSSFFSPRSLLTSSAWTTAGSAVPISPSFDKVEVGCLGDNGIFDGGRGGVLRSAVWSTDSSSATPSLGSSSFSPSIFCVRFA